MSEQGCRQPVGRGLAPRRNVRSAAGDKPPPYGESAVEELAEVARIAPPWDEEVLEGPGEGALRPGGLALTSRALAASAVGAGARVLDLGCGTAVTVGYLRRARSLRALGVDLEREPLRRGLERGALPLVQGSGSELPLAGGSVELVLAECSLSLMPDGALSECWRVLTPGGRLAVTDLYARAPCEEGVLRSPSTACGAWVATREELTAADGSCDPPAPPPRCERDVRRLAAPLAGGGTLPPRPPSVSSLQVSGAIISRLEAHGFRVQVWEDHSRALAEYAARLVLAGGSLPAAWGGRVGCAGEASPSAAPVRRARPGYFLLVAAKERRAGGVPPRRGEEGGAIL